MNNNVVNLIKFLEVLVLTFKSMLDIERLAARQAVDSVVSAAVTTEKIASEVMARIVGLPAICAGLTNVTRLLHKGDVVNIDYWNRLRQRLLDTVVQEVILNPNSREYQIREYERKGMVITDYGESSVYTEQKEQAIKDGELAQLRLFGNEFYRIAKQIKQEVADGTYTDTMDGWENVHNIWMWWHDAKDLLAKGFVVSSSGDELILVQREVLPMPETVVTTREGLTEIARLLSLVITRNESMLGFFLNGVYGLDQKTLDGLKASKSDLDFADYRIGSIAKLFANHWLGGEPEAITVLNMLLGFATTDCSGLVRTLRALARGAHDLGMDARVSKNPSLNPVFHLSTLPNGVPCLWVYKDEEWKMVVTEECKRLRKTVITNDEFIKATELPSIVCSYAGSRMVVLMPLQKYSTAAKGGMGILNKVLALSGLYRFGVTPMANPNATSDKDATRWLRMLELPNLLLHTRVDHISCELTTGRVNRQLIFDELDNVLVVANVLSRSQFDNSSRELFGESKLSTNLKYSGRNDGRVYQLFPKVTQTGIKIPGDLLVLAGKIHEDLMNPRWANGTTVTIVGDPRLDPNDCLLPAYMKPYVNNVDTKYAKLAKMPNYTVFELRIVGYSADNVLHINPALAAIANADFDGDQMQVQLTVTDAPMLSPSSQGGHYLQTYRRKPAVVGIPKVANRDYAVDFSNLVAGKGLIGVGVEFWRQAMQAIAELNPFKLSYVHNMFVKHNEDIVRILTATGYDRFVVDGVANWDMFVAEFPEGEKIDYFADLTASIYFELIMPKSKLEDKALAMLSRLGIDPKSVKTLAGQLDIMERVAEDPIGTLEIFQALDSKLINKWLPRVIISMLAMHRVCVDRQLSIHEIVGTAPAGRLFHLSRSRWKNGLLNIMKTAVRGFAAILDDMLPVKMSESSTSSPMLDMDDEDSGNDFFKTQNVYNQQKLVDELQKAVETHDCRMSHSNGIAYIPTMYAVELFRRYIELVDGETLSIMPYSDEEGNNYYALINQGGVVYMEGILQRFGSQPGEEFAELYFLDILCPVCGSVYGYCEHVYCARCKKLVGTCACTTPEDIRTAHIDGKLDPRKALAWLLTRPNVGPADLPKPGVDTILSTLRTEMKRTVGGGALSTGEVFNRFMKRFARRLAYKPGGNVSLEMRRYGANHGYNLNMVATEWAVCPKEAAIATHPAYASVASDVKHGMYLAKKYHLCATTTSNSRPGKWMRHMTSKGNFASFIHMIDPGHGWTTSKRDAVRIKFEQSAPIISGGVTIPVAWEGIPIEVLPQVFAPVTVYYSMDWNDLDQFAFTSEYMDSISVCRQRKFNVRKDFVVHVNSDMTFTLQSRGGEYIGRHLLISDPSGLLEPIIVKEIGTATYVVEFNGKFEETEDGFVAKEDASITILSDTSGCTGMKLVDPFGNKGLMVRIQDLTPDRFVLLGEKLVKVDCYLSPDRFSEDKMQAGASVINAVFTQVRKLMIDNGTHNVDEPLRIPTDIPQEEMLEFALMWLHSELSSRINMSEELIEKLELATVALQKAETIEERVKALWSLAFHPMYEVINGEHVHVADVMMSYHPVSVQNLFPQENCTIPKSRRSEDTIKFDRFGCGALNIGKNNSSEGLALRMNYTMSVRRCPELVDELYGPYELVKHDSAKVYLWEQIMSCALQRAVVAFPELGPVAHPRVTRIESTAKTNTNKIVTLVQEEESTEEYGIDDCTCVVVD